METGNILYSLAVAGMVKEAFNPFGFDPASAVVNAGKNAYNWAKGKVQSSPQTTSQAPATVSSPQPPPAQGNPVSRAVDYFFPRKPRTQSPAPQSSGVSGATTAPATAQPQPDPMADINQYATFRKIKS
jgi:hypothetical protein